MIFAMWSVIRFFLFCGYNIFNMILYTIIFRSERKTYQSDDFLDVFIWSKLRDHLYIIIIFILCEIWAIYFYKYKYYNLLRYYYAIVFFMVYVFIVLAGRKVFFINSFMEI